MSKSFVRENRYIVINRKDLGLLTDSAKDELGKILYELSLAKKSEIDTSTSPEIEYVVVKRNWPIYEETWENIERMCLGKKSIGDELSELKEAIKPILIWCSEYVEAEAECLKESHTDPRGKWEDEDSLRNYEIEMGKVTEINAILELISG